jgi:hypothetical protein
MEDQTVSSDQTETSFLTTKKFAELFHVEPATTRRGLCVNGHYMGIKPLKLPNGRLLWPENEAKKVIQPETPENESKNVIQPETEDVWEE